MSFLVFKGKGDNYATKLMTKVTSGARSLTLFFTHASTSSDFDGLCKEDRTFEIPRPHHSDIPYVLESLRAPNWYKHFAALGCRRIVRDQGYLQSLSRANVRLTFDNITRVEPDGIVTETSLHVSFTGRQFQLTSHCPGENIQLDVLICATGFVTVCIV
jgi:hypothetical protein